MLDESVESPPHYRGDGDIECMDAMRSMFFPMDMPPIESWWWGCAFKYLWRWPLKNGIEDLYKCRKCIDYLIAEAEISASYYEQSEE